MLRLHLSHLVSLAQKAGVHRIRILFRLGQRSCKIGKAAGMCAILIGVEVGWCRRRR